MEALLAARSDLEVHVRGEVSPHLFPSPGGIRFHRAKVDVGLVQPDALTADLESTRDQLNGMEGRWSALVEDGAEWLRSIRARLVLADIPPLAFDVAAAADVPAFAVGNFSWDWIYRSYGSLDPAFARHADRAARAYSRARALYRLPFYGDMSAFPEIHDAPLVARRSPLSRDEARRHFGLPREVPLALLSFGGIGLRSIDFRGLGAIRHFGFVTTDTLSDPPPNVFVVRGEGVDYAALIRACDVVVTKPGWGITAAAIVNPTRVLYTSRGPFPEYPVLVDALEAHTTALYVSPDRLRSGEIGPELDALFERPVREPAISSGGDRVIADHLLRHLER